MYFQVLDLLVGELDIQFNQKLLEIPKSIERVLLASCIPDHKNRTDIDVPAGIKENYSKDIDMRKLGHQLNHLPDLIQTSRKTDHYAPLKRVTTLHTLVSIFQDNPFIRKMLSEVENLLKIYITIPITTSTSKRSFSAMKRLKSSLRLTMTQQRLNNVMLLHIHKYDTDNLDMTDIAS